MKTKIWGIEPKITIEPFVKIKMFIKNAITSLIMQYQNFANLNAQTSTLHCTVLSSSWPKSKSQQNIFFSSLINSMTLKSRKCVYIRSLHVVNSLEQSAYTKGFLSNKYQ